MKKIRIFLLAIVVFVISASLAMAAEEGLVQKLRNKFTGGTQKAAVKKDAAKENVSSAIPAQKTPEARKARPSREYTRDEMIERLKDNLSGEDEIFSMVPELKMEKDSKGEAIYKYSDVKIEDLTDEKLKNLFGKVNQAAIKIRTERINEQLETIRNVQNIQNQQRVLMNANQANRAMVRAPAQIAVPQAVQSIPRVPQAPPQIPRTPQAPPAPPRIR